MRVGRCRGSGAGRSLHLHLGPLPEGEGEPRRCRWPARSRLRAAGDSARRLRGSDAGACVGAGPSRRDGRAGRGGRGGCRPGRRVRMTSASERGRSRCRACGGGSRSGSALGRRRCVDGRIGSHTRFSAAVLNHSHPIRFDRRKPALPRPLRPVAASCDVPGASDSASPSTPSLLIPAENRDCSRSYSGSYGLLRKKPHQAPTRSAGDQKAPRSDRSRPGWGHTSGSS